MDRGLLAHTCIAVASVGAAYAAWVRPRTTDAAPSVVVVDVTPTSLQEVCWEGEGVAVRVTRAGSGLRVTTTKLAAGTPAPPEDPAVVYPGSAQAEALFAHMAPLRAARGLGRLDAARRAALGLDAPAERLVLRAGGATHALALGHAAYGTRDVFCMAANGEVYLLPASTLATLRHGGVALHDHGAVGLGTDAFDRIEVTFAGDTRTLVQRRGAAPEDIYYADPADPTRKLPLWTAWLGRATHLTVVAPLPQATAPPQAARLRLHFFAEQSEVAAVTVWPATEALPAAGESSRFATPVSFYRATIEALVRDAPAAWAEGR